MDEGPGAGRVRLSIADKKGPSRSDRLVAHATVRDRECIERELINRGRRRVSSYGSMAEGNLGEGRREAVRRRKGREERERERERERRKEARRVVHGKGRGMTSRAGYAGRWAVDGGGRQAAAAGRTLVLVLVLVLCWCWCWCWCGAGLLCWAGLGWV